MSPTAGLCTVLVTGASGVVGTALLHRLSARPGRLRLLSRQPMSGGGNCEVLHGDVRDPAVIAAALDGVGTVIHLAAQTSGPEAEADPVADWHANVAPLLHMLERGREEGTARTILLAGSETQAGPSPPVPLDERARDAPVTIYDLHRLAAEQLLETYVRRGLAHGACLRLPTVYGPGPPSRGRGRGMVDAMVRRALAGHPISVYGRGTARRDLLHVDDVAAAFLAALDHPEAVDGRHFVLGTGAGISIGDAARRVAREVARQTGAAPVAVRHVPVPADWSVVDERDVVVDASAFRAATGWRPVTDFASGLAVTVRAMASGRHR
jgi:nucleoside-diphosphate-sugar epimerase